MVERTFDPQSVEKKWQTYWEEKGLFRVDEKSEKPKFYCLEMFAYPSGYGIHVGHPRNYIATDIFARYYKMRGFEVLRPTGWDAFGLPTENYAIKNDMHPEDATEKNVANITRQVKSLGLAYDWSREINTSTPAYYKWTQWLFKTLFDNGYAYQKEGYVNWCPKDQTVLANEQVVGGLCERCGSAVEQQKMTQWFFKITDFADELLAGLDNIDWPEATKEKQRNWIGRSEGGEIDFAVVDSSEKVRVFTTRADTLFGATFLVLAPEHSLVEGLTTDEQREEVEAYIQEAKTRSELERTMAKEKTGAFTGSYAINPGNGEEVPIYIADYVSANYGHGAIMGVPAHDERDHEFAEKFFLNIVPVIEGENELPFNAEGVLINSGDFDGLDSHEAATKILEKVGGEKKVIFKLRDWSVSRQRYWGAPIPIVYDAEGIPRSIEVDDLPVLLPRDVEFRPTGKAPLATSETFQEGVEKKYGEGSSREFDTMDTFVDSAWYYLRYCDPDNESAFASEESLKKWMPVDLYIGGPEHTTGHLLYARFITRVLHKLGYLEFDEPFTKLRHQGIVLAEDGSRMSKSKGNVVNPDELISTVGADTLRLYEMFMGPFDQDISWDSKGILGVKRFLDRLYKQVLDKKDSNAQINEGRLHKLVDKVTNDIQQLKFNTMVSSFMQYSNELGEEEGAGWIETVAKLIAPVAPHFAEEIWQEVLGNKESVFLADWPIADPEKVKDEVVNIAIQEKGKLRGSIEVPSDTSEEEVVLLLAQNDKFKPLTEIYKNRVFVKNRVINFV